MLQGLFTAQTLVAGLMLVFLGVVALELLGMGDSGVRRRPMEPAPEETLTMRGFALLRSRPISALVRR